MKLKNFKMAFGVHDLIMWDLKHEFNRNHRQFIMDKIFTIIIIDEKLLKIEHFSLITEKYRHFENFTMNLRVKIYEKIVPE